MPTLYPDSDAPALVLYGDETNNPRTFSRGEYQEFSEDLSSVFQAYAGILARDLSEFSGLSNAFNLAVARRTVVPIVHSFFDRLVRIQRIARKVESPVAFVPRDSFEPIGTIEEVEGLISVNYQFNEYIISLLGPVCGLLPTGVRQREPGLAEPSVSANHMFEFRSSVKVRQRFFRLLKKLRGKNRSAIPALGFANADAVIESAGLFLELFERLPLGWLLAEGPRQLDLRAAIFAPSKMMPSDASSFLVKYGFTPQSLERVAGALSCYIQEVFPLCFLEKLRANSMVALEELGQYKSPCVISSGDGNSEAALYLAAARELGRSVIKAQHGGLYGYIQDISPVTEVEWPSCDSFLSWGWTEIPHHYAEIQRMSVECLPSPWLSERRKYLAALKRRRNFRADILWMPQLMKRFTHAPQGGSSISRDLLPEFSSEIENLVRSAKAQCVTLYCKPYNRLSLLLMRKTFDRLRSEYATTLKISEHYEKGLSRNLVADFRLLLLDQPGTGFLECLTAGIPTMVLWSRLYCHEEEWAKSDFQLLENCGLIHRTSESLISEFQSFKSDPDNWMNDLARKSAIANFCYKYARTSENWRKEWKSRFAPFVNQPKDPKY